jgi:hypothetical protein
LKEEAKRGNSLDEAKMKGPKEWGENRNWEMEEEVWVKGERGI